MAESRTGDRAAAVASSLAATFRGDLLRPGQAGYLAASRVWNGAVAKTPGLIARCRDGDDVRAAVTAARAADVTTAVRCGGHSLAGYSTCEGGVVIDLSLMRDVEVEPSSRRARASGGCLLGTIDAATQPFGLAFPAGVVSHTGAAGLILGGGTGWLTRLCGLSCDNVRGFELVTADGACVRAHASENADLFWALRGGGGNFGIVTRFDLALHPLGSLLLAIGLWAGDDMHRVLRDWRAFMAEAPDELKWNLSLRLAADADDVPADVRGRPVASGTIVWFGDDERGGAYADRIFAVGAPLAMSRRRISYMTLQTMADEEFPHGRRYYTKSGYFASLDDTILARLIEALATVPSATTQIELAHVGGAAGRVPASETAFGDRSAPFIINLLADWVDPAEDARHVGWVREVFASVRPMMKPGVYVNFMSGDEEDRTREAYGEQFERMVAVKTRYDPTNFFRLNQNIPPLA